MVKKSLDLLFNQYPENKDKCIGCNQTLTHMSTLAEVETGAPLGTVTKEIADRHNETALPNDIVTGNALRQRVLQYRGEKHRGENNCSNGTVVQPDDPISSEERRQQTDDLKIYGNHIFVPIDRLTTCPVSAAEAAGTSKKLRPPAVIKVASSFSISHP